jgi:hypothetical protein
MAEERRPSKNSSKLNFEEDRRLVLMKKVIVLSTVLGLSALGMACGDAAPANNAANKPANTANTAPANTNAKPAGNVNSNANTNAK